jgi:putative oxidoreductase
MKNRLFTVSSLDTDIAAALLRFILGGLMAYHGWMKIENYDTYAAMFADPIGLGPKLSFNLVIFAEFFCGLLLLIGLLTRLAVIPIMIDMGVAFFIAHKEDVFMNKELPFTFLLLTLPVFILGSGAYSIDALFRRNKKPS